MRKMYNFDLKYTPPDFTLPHLAGSHDVTMEPAPADGLAPTAFYSSTNFPTYVKREGKWHLAKKARMDRTDRVGGENRRVRLHRDA